MCTPSFVGNHFLHVGAEIAGEELVQMIRVAEQISRSQDRPLGHLVCDVLRRDVAHLQVAALERDELGALLEQVAAVVAFECELTGDVLREHLHHVRADVLFGEHRGEAKLRLLLRDGRQRDRWRPAHRSKPGGVLLAVSWSSSLRVHSCHIEVRFMRQSRNVRTSRPGRRIRPRKVRTPGLPGRRPFPFQSASGIQALARVGRVRFRRGK